MTKFYVVQHSYVGPNQNDHVDSDRIEITTEPARSNMAPYGIITKGWCGTTNDWRVEAFGVFDDIDAARVQVETFGEMREIEVFHSGDEMAEIYKFGKFAPMSREGTGNWAYEGVLCSVDAATTDQDIHDLVAEFEASANDEGYSLDEDYLREMIEDHRQKCLDDLDEAA